MRLFSVFVFISLSIVNAQGIPGIGGLGLVHAQASTTPPAFRSSSHSAEATAANVTGTEPAGCASNDIEIASLYIESDNAVTAPASWTNTFNGTAMLAENNTASHAYRQYGFWIRRGGSAPALQWTFSSAFSYVDISCWSGANTSGDPFSFGDHQVRDTTAAATYPNTSGTTAVDNELLIFMGDTFSGRTSATPPTGFTERDDGGTGSELADKTQATVGATGTVTGAAYAGGVNDTASALLMGLKP